jgi:glycosyltransferase involved in cell wall biosynthesis
MPRSQPDVDICLLADGITPRTIGGVTRWAANLAAALPELRFVMTPSTGALPDARIYHALTPSAAATAATGVRDRRRPLLLTCHAMHEAWRDEGAPAITPDSSISPRPTPVPISTPVPHATTVISGERHGYAAADRITAVSSAVAASHAASGAPCDRMVVIRNGAPRVDTPRIVTDPLIGFVGRVAPVKGVERLLAATRLVRSERPDAKLVIIGPLEAPRAYRARLERLAEAPGLRGAVTFIGPDRPERWYPRLTCLAMASDSEGMPLALLEAMMHGVPCVAPDVGGVREALGDGGVLVAARDTDALAAGILGILNEAARAATLSAAARARADQWTAADAAAAYAELYTSLGVACTGCCC